MENRNSQSVRILDFIASCSNGATFTEIQKILYGYTHSTPYTRKNRGWWCTQLLGSPGHHTGLLHKFCVKRNGKWYRNDIDHKGTPWALIPRIVYNVSGSKVLHLEHGVPNPYPGMKSF